MSIESGVGPTQQEQQNFRPYADQELEQKLKGMQLLNYLEGAAPQDVDDEEAVRAAMEGVARQDFGLPGTEDLTDRDGNKFSREQARAAEELLEVRREQVNRITIHIGNSVLSAVAEEGIGVNEMGGAQKLEAEVKADIAETLLESAQSGRDGSSSPTSEKQIQDIRDEEVARRTAEYYDKNPERIREIAEYKPEKVADIVGLVSARRGGGFSRQTARQTGRRLAGRNNVFTKEVA